MYMLQASKNPTRIGLFQHAELFIIDNLVELCYDL